LLKFRIEKYFSLLLPEKRPVNRAAEKYLSFIWHFIWHQGEGAQSKFKLWLLQFRHISIFLPQPLRLIIVSLRRRYGGEEKKQNKKEQQQQNGKLSTFFYAKNVLPILPLNVAHTLRKMSEKSGRRRKDKMRIFMMVLMKKV
jgi:hypothetical protein